MQYQKIKRLGSTIAKALPILSLSLTSIVWYLVLANHTMRHPFLSFRTAFVLWFAVLVFIFKIIIDGIKEDSRREEAYEEI